MRTLRRPAPGGALTLVANNSLPPRATGAVFHTHRSSPVDAGTPSAWFERVIFVETPTFSKRVLDLLEDDEYRARQTYLALYPAAGKVIAGSGGIRKLRWAGGQDKHGGLRVIYYWWVADDRIAMLFLYRKNEQDNLTPPQVKRLRQALDL